MLPFLFKIAKNAREWRFALADRGLDYEIDFARHRLRDRQTII